MSPLKGRIELDIYSSIPSCHRSRSLYEDSMGRSESTVRRESRGTQRWLCGCWV